MNDLPGFRFFPTEEELVSFYLHNKLEGATPDLDGLLNRVVPVVDIYEFNPWDLPQFSGELCHGGDPEQWFFFIPMQESEARGGRPKRLTTSGYWKATGSPGYIYSSGNRTIGVKRTMVFYVGRAPSGRKTEWKMNEYKAIEAQDDSSGSTPKVCMQVRQEYSLCRVYKHSKCLRAFDRRPTAPINQVTHQQLDLPSGTGTALVTESSSAPNSLVNDHACSSSAAGNCFSDNDGDHPIDDNPNEVNWDQLDWFYRNE